MSAMSANPYDEVPYESHAYAASHPNRLATVATLFGMSPAAPARCRVLEIGCAGGGNLLPMAAAFPESRFIGIDYSAVQIAAAEQARNALGLTNIEFRCEDVRGVDARALGEFDYAIAHGIYSWLPPEAQSALLALYRSCLAPQGVGYVSYNTLPGWRMRGIVRDMMRFHAELFGNPQTQVAQARALMDFVTRHIPTENSPYGQYLKSELGMLSKVTDSYVLHEHLEAHNEPLYFRDFVARIRTAGLDYLGEAEFHTMVGTGVSREALAQLNKEIRDIVRLEQYVDFLRNRSFRMTLLTKRGVPLSRNVAGERVATLAVSGRPQPVGDVCETDASPATFQEPGGQGVRTTHAVTKAAMAILAERFPAAVPFAELLAAVRARLSAAERVDATEAADRAALANDVLVAYTVPGLLRLDADPPPVAGVPGERPLAWSYARWQAAQGAVSTSLRHEPVRLADVGRALLPLLDGTRDRAALRTILFEATRAGRLSVQREGATHAPQGADDPVIAAVLDAVLTGLARNALLQPA